jgi:protein SCO1
MKKNPDAKTAQAVPASWAAGLAALVSMAPIHAADEHSHHQHHQHHQHMEQAAKKEAARSSADYRLKSVKLVRADGARVEFPADIDDGRPVFVNFIYTTCTAICPVMTQIFSAFEKKLGAEASKVRLVSISIDPEQDTPKRLAEYARQYAAGPDWTFYTGTVAASTAVQKGFAAYRGDKMNHTPLTLIRPAPGKPWVRLDGFSTPDDLMREYRLIVDAR